MLGGKLDDVLDEIWTRFWTRFCFLLDEFLEFGSDKLLLLEEILEVDEYVKLLVTSFLK